MKDPRLILAAFAIALLVFVVTVKPEEVDVYDCTYYEPEIEQSFDKRQLVEGWIRQSILIENLDWDEEQVEAMRMLCWKESRFNHLDQNPTSTAYGLYQELDSTWAGTGIEKTSDPLLQTVSAARYIKARYGTPAKALEFWNDLHLVNGKLVHYY